MTRSDPEVTSFHLHSQVAVEGRKLGFYVCLSSNRAITRRRWQPRDRQRRHVTFRAGSDPEVTSFDRKSPGSGCGRAKTRVLCTFKLLQGGNSQEVQVTWQEMMSRDRKWCHFTESHLEVAVKGLKLRFCLRLSSHRAVTRRMCSYETGKTHVTSHDRKWPGSIAGSHLEVAVDGLKLVFCKRLSSFRL